MPLADIFVDLVADNLGRWLHDLGRAEPDGNHRQVPLTGQVGCLGPVTVVENVKDNVGAGAPSILNKKP